MGRGSVLALLRAVRPGLARPALARRVVALVAAARRVRALVTPPAGEGAVQQTGAVEAEMLVIGWFECLRTQVGAVESTPKTQNDDNSLKLETQNPRLFRVNPSQCGKRLEVRYEAFGDGVDQFGCGVRRVIAKAHPNATVRQSGLAMNVPEAAWAAFAEAAAAAWRVRGAMMGFHVVVWRCSCGGAQSNPCEHRGRW